MQTARTLISRRHEIEHYLAYLSQLDLYDDEQGMSVFKVPVNPFPGFDLDVCRCTSGAMLIANRFDGKVFGYQIPDSESHDLIGIGSGGHDFAVIGNYLVDYWAENVEGTGKSLYDMTDHVDMELIKQKYLPRDQWVELEI